MFTRLVLVAFFLAFSVSWASGAVSMMEAIKVERQQQIEIALGE